MLKINFIVENDKVFITQIHKGKRTTKAALKIACDFAEEQGTNNSTEQNTSQSKVKIFDKKQ